MKDTINIPEGYHRITPYLIIKNAHAFMQFMHTVFAATEILKVMRDEALIMHAELQIGDSVIMLADATEQYQVQNAGIFIYVQDCDSTYQVALDNGAISIFPPANQEYGRSAGVKDTFGNSWWLTSL